MTDDLLRALGRHQRHELDEPPDAVDDDELLQPFDDATRDALLDGLDRACEPAASTSGPAITSAAAITSAPTTTLEPTSAGADAGAKVYDLALRRRAAIVGILLASAAALAFVIWAAEDRERRQDAAIARLPAYETSQARGGKASQRGEPDVAVLELEPGDELDWVVTPAEPVSRQPSVALLAEAAGQPPRFVADPPVEVAASGAIRVRGTLDRLLGGGALAPGEWTLTLLIAPPEALPRTLADARAGAGSWQRVVLRVTIVASP